MRPNFSIVAMIIGSIMVVAGLAGIILAIALDRDEAVLDIVFKITLGGLIFMTGGGVGVAKWFSRD